MIDIYANEMNSFQCTGAAAELDTPVLLLFFNRPEQFEKVFLAVKKVKPAHLYLYQDGPRENRNDESGISQCRRIALEGIDWNCQVKTWFREKNCGCDPSEYLSQKWAFSTEERCIVLEDDDVPNTSFFYFCQELLERYKDDQRIGIISGMNHLGNYDANKADYLFTSICSIWGWASWKRVVDEWNDEYRFVDDEYAKRQLMFQNKNTQIAEVLKASRKHKESGKAYYETILASNVFLNHRLNIVPAKNLITNIGIAASSTHSADNIKKLPHGIRRVFNMPTEELSFPLNHPTYIVEDVDYQKQVKRILAWGHPMVKMFRKIERGLLYLKYKIIKN